MSFGALSFGSPLVLLAFIALPIIFILLRVTPPQPQTVDLPSLKLLERAQTPEETPVKTPWWIILLRLLAAGLAIFGLAQPVLEPQNRLGGAADGPVLLVVDDGWTSADQWQDVQRAGFAFLDGLDRDQPVHMLFTAPKVLHAPVEVPLTLQSARRVLRSTEPRPWLADRADALDRLEAVSLSVGRVHWITDGERGESTQLFIRSLQALGPLSVQVQRPLGSMAITDVFTAPQGATVRVARALTTGETVNYITAEAIDGVAIATTEVRFEPGATEAEAAFNLPSAALNRAARFRIGGVDSAGAVWLWDAASKRQRVGLVSTGSAAQPLLSDLYYAKKALAPFAEIIEAPLDSLIEQQPDAILLTDTGRLTDEDSDMLETWISEGGALIRFAGPRLAAQSDRLTPVDLRRASRALGGALSWEEPQAVADFPLTGPFAGITPPADARVSRQVLAVPTPELAGKTWARLEDGTPLVTADRIGEGVVILFHVTAGPDWSDIPYTGAFVEMLRRASAAGRGRETAVTGNGALEPVRRLDGFGRLNAPEAEDAPIAIEDFAETEPGPRSPPGIYAGSGATLTLNAGRAFAPDPISQWPSGVSLSTETEILRRPLAGPALGLAGALLLLDIFVALLTAGLLRKRVRSMASVFVAGLAAVALGSGDVAAQENDKAQAAALEMRFAYVTTEDPLLNDVTRAGLVGLSRILFTRTSIEPAEPHPVQLGLDELELYPLIYIAVPDAGLALNGLESDALASYLRNGGAVIIDTRDSDGISASTANMTNKLTVLLSGIDAPPLRPVPQTHVLMRAFYLVDGFPGRYGARPLWIEAGRTDGTVQSGDGVSGLFITDADLISAWAVDQYGRPLYSVDGGDRDREMSYRAGVNLVMYILTGNYKADQVHVPALLERLGADLPGSDGPVDLRDGDRE